MLRVILSTKAKKLESYGILQNGKILVQVLRHLISVIMAGMNDSTFIGVLIRRLLVEGDTMAECLVV